MFNSGEIIIFTCPCLLEPQPLIIPNNASPTPSPPPPPRSHPFLRHRDEGLIWVGRMVYKVNRIIKIYKILYKSVSNRKSNF